MTGIIHNTPNIVWASCSRCGQNVSSNLEHSCYLIKEMTDEEILATFNPKFMCDLDDSDVIDFGRAILRKAQEK